MKAILFLAFYVFSFRSFAAGMTVKVHPENPIAGEEFELRFEIDGSYDSEPYITFDKGSAEVLGKDEQGVSLSTTIINGRISTKKMTRYSYSLKMDKPGMLRIRNIKAQVDQQELSSPDISINVSSERKGAEDIFLIAEASKEQAYVGEAVRIDYYLYYKVPIRVPEIKEFPKLNGFLKRFYMPNENPIRVEKNGEIYQKSAKYSAILFPEKSGDLTVDSLKLAIEYEARRENSPYFSPFGFNMGQFRQKTISSEKIKLKILPLPSEGVTEGFTGLVGDHKFNLKIDKTKFLVNEPIEATLEVEGNGALEKMEDPALYDDPNLEKFDTKGDFSEINQGMAKKIFNFTFLGRGPLKINEKQLSLSYFSPTQQKYIEVRIKVPAIEVIGGALASTSNSQNEKVEEQSSKNKNEKDSENIHKSISEIISKNTELMSPIFNDEISVGNINLNKIVNFFAIINFLLISFLLFRKRRESANSTGYDHLFQLLKKGRINYNQFALILELYRSSPSQLMSDIILSLNISSEAKKYLKDYLLKLEKYNYDLNSNSETIKFDQKVYTQLKKARQESGNFAKS